MLLAAGDGAHVSRRVRVQAKRLKGRRWVLAGTTKFFHYW
jgi:hypothetical protein